MCCIYLSTWQRNAFQWCHNERDGVSNHQPHGCLLNRLFRRRSKKTPKLRVTGLCEGNSPVTDEFPAQRASNAENVSLDDVIMVISPVSTELAAGRHTPLQQIQSKYWYRCLKKPVGDVLWLILTANCWKYHILFVLGRPYDSSNSCL